MGEREKRKKIEWERENERVKKLKDWKKRSVKR